MTKKTALFPAALLLLLATSCRPFLLEPQLPEGASLVVRFHTPGAGSRTVVPQADLGITSIHVAVTGPGGLVEQDVTLLDDCVFPDLVPGDLTVDFHAAAGAATVASGTTDVTLVAGQTLEVPIDLAPTTGGTGAFAFTMIWPESTGAAYVQCHLGGPYGQEPTPDLSGGIYTATYSATGVPSGAYDLFVTFRTASGGTVLGAFVESVNIYGNLTSDTWLDGDGNHLAARTFTAEEMRDSLTTLSRLVFKGSDLSTWDLSPPGALTDLGTIPSADISFTPTLEYPGCGQSLSYTWNTPDVTPIASDASSAPLTLEGAAGNTLTITVTSSSGGASTYVVTTRKGYTITYHGNGAIGGTLPGAALCYAGQAVTLPGNDGGLVRPGFAWIGWSTNPGATWTYASPYPMVASPITLYAVWTADVTPPSDVTDLLYSTDAGTVTLSWTDPLDADLAGIKVTYTGGSTGYAIAAPTVGGAEINGLVDHQLYSFVVRAFDRSDAYSTGTSVSIYPGAYPDGTYTVSAPGGSITISVSDGQVTITDCDPAATSVDIPSSIGGYPVSAIGNSAFQGCGSLASVTIPGSVTTLGWRVFENCTSLTSITIPDSVTSMGLADFRGCSNLQSVTLSDSITRIPEECFSSCGKLSAIVIPDSVTQILRSAFIYCDDLTSLTIPNSVTYLGSDSLCNTGITSLAIPSSVTSIASDALNYSPLTEIVVDPANAAYCSVDGVLYNKAQTTLVKYPEARADATYDVPDTVTTLGNYSFITSDVTQVIMPPWLTSIGSYAFWNGSLTTLELPAGFTTLGSFAFGGCDFTSLTIPDSVTSIPQRCFEGCPLITLTLPETLTSIGSMAFINCDALTTVTLPGGVGSIAGGAFRGCTALASVHVEATSPPTLGDDTVFDYNAGGRIIYVPASGDDSIIGLYQGASFWNEYAMQEEAEP